MTSGKVFERWLHRKAIMHVRRDRRRGNTKASVSSYKKAIRRAVLRSGGRDEYTGEALRWDLVSTYRNEGSKKGKRSYKRRFALLPTVDHSDRGRFRICSWRTNSGKADMTEREFLNLCRAVVRYQEKKGGADSGPPVKRR